MTPRTSDSIPLPATYTEGIACEGCRDAIKLGLGAQFNEDLAILEHFYLDSGHIHSQCQADSQPKKKMLPTYVLITPARNEERFIEKTIASMIRQTVLPLKWVIVNDGSTDCTASIANGYAAEHEWIEVVNTPAQDQRNFAAKVHAFNVGLDRVRRLNYDVVANLDADTSFDEYHFEFLLGKFAVDSKLGVVGTVFREDGYNSETDSFEGQNHVSGQCQLFRRSCFEDIGGYVPNEAGGIDWIAVTTARMKGWRTQSFREKYFFHHRHLGTGERSPFAAALSYGYKDYYLGGSVLWEIFRCAYRATKKPYLVEGLALGLGYAWAMVRRRKKAVSSELARFHRKEQMQKLGAIAKAVTRFQRPDNFSVMPIEAAAKGKN